MKICNYSDKTYELYSWFPQEVQERAKKIIALPDLNIGKSPLPTGSVVVFDLNDADESDFYKYTESDVGCGMILSKSSLKYNEFDKKAWDNLALEIKGRKGKLGDLGSGNHFLDAMIDKNNNIYFLCHTGSRDESKKITNLVKEKNYKEYNSLYNGTRDWASENRLTILSLVEKYFGKNEILVHNDHNYYDIEDNSMIIRKGAVKIKPNELTIIPSSMTGDAIIVRATQSISNTFNSLSHGTGRVMSRSEAKDISFDIEKEIRGKIYIPDMIKNESLRTESPFVYRDVDSVVELLNGLITVEDRLKPIAYIGQL